MSRSFLSLLTVLYRVEERNARGRLSRQRSAVNIQRPNVRINIFCRLPKKSYYIFTESYFSEL